MMGVAADGSCLYSGSTASSYYANSILKFGQNSSFSCYVKVPSAASLATTCSNVGSLMLFKNFDGDIRFGQFGNSDFYKIKVIGYKYFKIQDGVPLETPDTVSTLGFTSGASTCEMPTREIINIFYAGYGRSSLPQDYIFKVVRTFETK